MQIVSEYQIRSAANRFGANCVVPPLKELLYILKSDLRLIGWGVNCVVPPLKELLYL